MDKYKSPNLRLSVRVKLILFVFAIVFSIIAAQTWISLINAKKWNEIDEKRTLIGRYYRYMDDIALLERAAAALTGSFSDRQDLKKLILDKDREGLLALLLPIFKNLKANFDLSHLCIHETTGHVLVRIHRPKAFGDLISAHRQTVSDAISQSRTVTGLVFDAQGLELCGVSPVFDKGRLIGLIEVGFDYDQSFILGLKARTSMDYKIWLSTETAASSGLQPKGYEPDPPSRKLFYFAGTTYAYPSIPESVYDRVLERKTPEVQFVSDEGQDLAVLVGPLLGYGGKAVGIIEISTSRTEALASLRRGQRITLAMAVGLALLALTLMWVFTHSVVLRPLEHLADVAGRQFQGDLNSRIEFFPLDESGQLGHTLNLLSNKLSETLEEQKQTIAELKTAEEGRRKSEGQLLRQRDLLMISIEALTHPFYVIDPNNYEIVLANSASGLVDLLDRPTCHAQTHGLPHPCSGREHPCPIKEIKRTKKSVTVEHVHKNKSGESRIVELHAYPVFDQDGDLFRVIEYCLDITENLNLQAQLRQAQKMEAIGTLAGGIAHDFNNLLQAIGGYTQILLSEKYEMKAGRREIQEIQNAADRAAQLVQRLLTFSRKVESRLWPLDLNREVIEIQKLLERTIPKMIEIELDLADDLRTVNADPAQIEQILINLGVNARDAMPEGGRLIIETANVILDKDYCQRHLGARAGEYVMLSVSDTGHGMDKETVDHIFEPFYTTKELGKGTGLGLAMVYGIVKSHRGYIMCYSEKGQGTTFKIFLPAQRHGASRSEEKTLDTVEGGDEVVLVVDDEKGVRDVATEILEQYGYTVICADSGERAVDIYRERGGRIDLVILDLGMPGMGGQACLKELLMIDPELKVVISSGYSAGGQVEDARKSGAAGFIGKPYPLTDLLRKVRGVLDQKNQSRLS